MRIHGFLLISIYFLSACTTFEKPPVNDGILTMNTDISDKLLSRAEYYEQLAIAYSADDQSDKAIENYKLSILHNAKRASTHLGLSAEYEKNKQNNLALVELEEALSLSPESKETNRRLVDFYLKNRLYSKAQDFYSKILSKNKSQEVSQWVELYLLKAQYKFDEALELLLKIELQSQRRDQVAYERALIYKATGDYRYYEQNLINALELNPDDREIALEYADYALMRDRYADVTQNLIKYSANHVFDLKISQKLSYAAVQSGNYETALLEYTKQRTHFQNTESIDLKKAHILFLSGDLKRAQKIYKAILDKNENDEALFYLSQIYLTSNRTSEAHQLLDQLSSNSDYFGEAQIRLALHSNEVKDPKKALSIMQKAYNLRSDLLPIFQVYADLLIQNKKFDEAKVLIEEGVQTFSLDENLRLKLAYLSFIKSDLEEFKKQISAALQINPESAEAYSMLAETWYLKNQKPEDIESFAKKALQLKSKNKNIKPLLAWALMQQNNAIDDLAIFEKFYEENPDEVFFARSLSTVYGRADLKNKSLLLSAAADQLEFKNNLKSRILFKEANNVPAADDFSFDPARLPASFEE